MDCRKVGHSARSGCRKGEVQCKGGVRCKFGAQSKSETLTHPGARSGPERISVAYGNVPAPGLGRVGCMQKQRLIDNSQGLCCFGRKQLQESCKTTSFLEVKADEIP